MGKKLAYIPPIVSRIQTKLHDNYCAALLYSRESWQCWCLTNRLLCNIQGSKRSASKAPATDALYPQFSFKDSFLLMLLLFVSYKTESAGLFCAP
jgi:hypothetical protein